MTEQAGPEQHRPGRHRRAGGLFGEGGGRGLPDGGGAVGVAALRFGQSAGAAFDTAEEGRQGGG